MTARTIPWEFDCADCGAHVSRSRRTAVDICRGCYEQRWYEAHRPEIRAAGRRRRAENPEAARAKERAKYRANPERQKAKFRRSRELHPELHRRYEKASYDRNREKRIAKSARWNRENAQRHAAHERARRARLAGTFVEFVHPLVVLELADGVCGICGEDVDPGNFQVDHIEAVSLGGEHSYSNTQPAHPRCNVSKGNRAA